MPIGPKHTLGGFSPTATRQFTDREDFIDVFENALADDTADSYHVVTYYGMGGIGKSRLRKKFQSMLDERGGAVTWATLNFETVQHRTVDNALYWMRSELRRKKGIRFLSFDLAYAVYWQKTHPQSALREDEVPFLSEGSLITELVGVAEDLPFVQIVAKLPGLIQKTSISVQEWWRRRGQEALREIRDMEPAEIADWLPAFWARDMKDHIESSGERVVLFIDTYEALWEGRRTESRFFTTDEWVREWVMHLPEVLWVITGREQLRWGELDEDWNDVLDQHLMGELTDADARRFLGSCGIRDDAIRDTIIAGGEGVPFFLDLAVDTYEEIEQAEDRVPEPADFAGTPREVLDRFLHYLSTGERETLKVLAVARQWDRALFAALIERFQTGYPATALAQLCRFSFIQETGTPGKWTLHALMRESLQEHHGDDALRAKVHQFLFNHYADQLRELDPKALRDAHQEALREAFHHGQHVLDTTDLRDWFEEVRDPFQRTGPWDFLLPIQDEFTEVIREQYGADHFYFSKSLSDLAFLHRKQGQYEEAKKAYRKAIKIGRAASQRDDAALSDMLAELALLYITLDQYDDAESQFEQALDMKASIFGSCHRSYATTLHQFARLRKKRGDFKKARARFEEALDIREEVLGSTHLHTAATYYELADLRKKQGRYGKAKMLYEKTLEIRKEKLGENDSSVAATFSKLAAFYRELGRYEEAEPYYENALEIEKRVYGDAHPTVATSLVNLANLHKNRGYYEKARQGYERALDIQEDVFGETHSRVARTLNNLAGLFLRVDKIGEAEPLYTRSYKILQDVFREPHPRIATAANNLGRLREHQGKYEEAEKLYYSALEMRKEVFEEDNHPRVLSTLYYLARLNRKKGALDESESLFRETLNTFENTFEEDQPGTAEILDDFAQLFVKKGEYRKAEPMYRRAAEIRDRLLGPTHPDTVAVQERLKALLDEY